MRSLPVVPRTRARRDVDEALAFYEAQGAFEAALGLVDALERAFETIARHPAIGSARWGDELALPGLRSWALEGYPFAAFYVERPDHVDVWRVLHLRSDLPVALGEVGAD